MSNFKAQFAGFFHGTLSTESQELAPTVIPVAPSVITNEDIVEVREERELVREVAQTSIELTADVDDVKSASHAIDQVAAAATLSTSAPLTQTDALVEVANESFDLASKILGVAIPKLSVNSDGTMNQESMEGMGSWFKNTAKSFLASVKGLGNRIKLSWSQMSISLKSLSTRIARVRAKMASRKGSGGKPLKLPVDIRMQLVKGDGYSGQLLPDTLEFASLTSAITKLLADYETRVREFIKQRAFEAINAGNGIEFKSAIKTDDLLKLLNELATKQNLLLGNRRFMQAGGNSGVLGYNVTSSGPDAKTLAKHLDAPLSLSNEEITTIFDALAPQIDVQLNELERVMSVVDNSYESLAGLLERLTASSYMDDDGEEWSFTDLGDNTNGGELLRLQYQVVEEVGRISTRLYEHYSDVANQFDAIIVLAEESIFQD